MDRVALVALGGGKEARAASDLTDWIMTVQQQDDAARSHALAKWRETGSTAWLVAAAVTMPAGHAASTDVRAAAAAVPRESPAYPTLTYHRLRLAIDEGALDAARAELDGLVPDPDRNLPRSTGGAASARP